MFEQVLAGNEAAKNTIASLLRAGRFPHALALTGEEGLGKKSLARAIAQALVCTGQEFPCNRCGPCLKAQKGIHPDIQTVYSDKKTGALGVELVRGVIADSAILPNEGEKKVYIIPGAEKMTVQAQNALLKTLEEPGGHCVFLLTCTEASMLLETIRSRVVCVSLSCVSQSAFEAALQAAGVQDQDGLFALSGGNIGRALSFSASGEAGRIRQCAQAIAQSVTRGDEYGCLKAFFALKGDEALFTSTMRMTFSLFRQALVWNGQKSDQTVAELARRLTRKRIAQVCGCLSGCVEARRYNCNEALNLTAVCADVFQALEQG